MGVAIRQAEAADAPAWLELLGTVAGEDYPDRVISDPAWALAQIQENETWIATSDGRIFSTVTFLPPTFENNNPVCNLGRHLNLPEAHDSGAARALMERAVELATARRQLMVARVLASDLPQQLLHESAGFFCAGFQPFKHSHRVRESVLFYYRIAGHDLSHRLPISESLPQVGALAAQILAHLNIRPAPAARDGVTGYPIQSEVQFSEGGRDDFEAWQRQAQSAHPPVEISGSYNQGFGYLRAQSPENSIFAAFALRNGKVAAGILYVHDPLDRCVRLADSFTLDDLSMGALLNFVVKKSEQHFSAIYVEVDILATAPRLLKSAEQIGFVPVAYLPAVFWQAGSHADVVKWVKLNLVYSLENVSLSSHAETIARIVDTHFQDQKMGVAVINLLRGLPFFDGLGDGELRKISRLFTQKLYRPGEKIFDKDDPGQEAYVVMRGQIDILLEHSSKPLVQFGNGQIFGELAFLDGSPRAAQAMANQASILLVIHRSAFNVLVQREPHLGMVVMRNIAIELSNRLRKTNQALVQK